MSCARNSLNYVVHRAQRAPSTVRDERWGHPFKKLSSGLQAKAAFPMDDNGKLCTRESFPALCTASSSADEGEPVPVVRRDSPQVFIGSSVISRQLRAEASTRCNPAFGSQIEPYISSADKLITCFGRVGKVDATNSSGESKED